jgi:hypothetical protein
MSEPSSASRETCRRSLNVAVTSIAAFTYFGNRVDEGKPRICPDHLAAVVIDPPLRCTPTMNRPDGEGQRRSRKYRDRQE